MSKLLRRNDSRRLKYSIVWCFVLFWTENKSNLSEMSELSVYLKLALLYIKGDNTGKDLLPFWLIYNICNIVVQILALIVVSLKTRIENDI